MKKPQVFFFILIMLFSSSLFGQEDQDVPVSGVQTIADDLVVQGSECVGVDCVTGEVFGFDTLRFKENNLRIGFNDTSGTGTFPSNDWEITINDSSNGGANYFGVTDITAGNRPFTVSAGAGNDALYVDDTGNVGLGTNNPVLELHIADGDSPSIRIEQNGASGFTPQTWDIAGNESNFFIRDVTNASQLPFRIQPNAGGDAIYVATGGNVSLGDASPSEKLEVNGNTAITGNAYIAGQAGIATITPAANASLDLAATDKALLLNRLTTVGRADLVTAGALAGMLVYDSDDNKVYYYNGTNWVDSSGDDQNLTAATLSATTLTIDIQDGSSVSVDLAPILAPLQTQITDLITRVETLEACACSTLTTPEVDAPNVLGIKLNQNIPNPFDSTTEIKYNVPEKYNSAKIQVVNSLGQIVYDIPITKFGEGSISLRKKNLQSAVYFYTLYVEGKKIDTKRLVIN